MHDVSAVRWHGKRPRASSRLLELFEPRARFLLAYRAHRCKPGEKLAVRARDGRAVVEFPQEQEDRVGKLKKELDNALDGWDKLVLLLP